MSLSLETFLTCILQANRIVKLENLDKLVNLNELYISENGIEKIENLEENKQLETLDLAKNRITRIENIAHLEEIADLWLNHNNVEKWVDVDELKHNKKLDTIYLEGNPISKDVQYRTKLKFVAPWLNKIDATLCR